MMSEYISMSNRFSRIVNKINNGPEFLRQFLLTRVFCGSVKYAGTSKIKLLSVSANKAVLRLNNIKRVQNHIGGIHAIAASLLAESTTGIVVGMNVPDDRVPVLKSMTVNFKRRMQGNLVAEANLSDEQINQITSTEKGETNVVVTITDDSGQQPIEVDMLWAWIPKIRKK